MKERSLLEWFDILERTDDAEVIRLFCTGLDKYQGTPTTADMIQFVNLFAALRMHQLKRGRL